MKKLQNPRYESPICKWKFNVKFIYNENNVNINDVMYLKDTPPKIL